ncbi:hypothetical protein [Pedobacter metabolipauper]|uniref:Uncharacterized protein n=1 Tax=Pedobacter metabolipauper TaxID=425513 RepID=A0A4R6SSH5_9SPHI|nr:hypothetical protein [Pedobacter metabolipauper]TDQ06853.1 hypothetical protein ATK78_3865 [Pedobacter metabolipauper]
METPNNLCTCCYRTYSPNDVFCNGCGFPLQGTEQEQAFYQSERTAKEIDLGELTGKVESARKSLYWIAVLIGVSTFITYFGIEDEQEKMAQAVIAVIIICAFSGLAIWGKRKPTTAMISGLSLYLILIILSAIVDPLSILSGIIIKVIIIGYLIKGIKAVVEADKLKKELNID